MVSNALIFQHEQMLRFDIIVAGRRQLVLNLSTDIKVTAQ